MFKSGKSLSDYYIFPAMKKNLHGEKFIEGNNVETTKTR